MTRNVTPSTWYHRAASGHTDWCARDHRCNLGEHRSEEMVTGLPGHGRAVVTRVRDEQGREYAEVRARVRLHTTDTGARWQIGVLLSGLDLLLSKLVIRRGVLRQGAERPALSSSR
jgi:hypothetical protein